MTACALLVASPWHKIFEKLQANSYSFTTLIPIVNILTKVVLILKVLPECEIATKHLYVLMVRLNNFSNCR